MPGRLFFPAFCFLPLCLYAQHGTVDSLKNILKISKEDSNKVNVLCELGKLHEGTNALNYIKQALELAEKLNFRNGIAQSSMMLGKYYYFNEEFSRSLEYCIRALGMAEEGGNPRLCAIASRYIGYNHFQNAPKIASEYYVKSVEYSKKANDSLLESYALSAIGNLYESWYDGKNALAYYLRSLAIRKKSGTSDERVSSLIETARAYDRTGFHDKCMELVYEARDIAEKKGKDNQNLVYIYQMIGYDYAGKHKDYRKALEYFLKSYQLSSAQGFLSKNDFGSIPPVADMYMKLGDYKKSAEYYKIYFSLLEKYQQKFDRKLYELQDSLKKETQKKELIKRDSEISEQKAKTRDEKNIRNIFIAGSFVLLVLVFFIYRNYRFRLKLNVMLKKKVSERTAELITANQHLQLSEMQLKDANEEMEAFVYKASHDLRGPLSSSRSLVEFAIKDGSYNREYMEMVLALLDKMENILTSLHEAALIRRGALVMKEIDIEKTIMALVTGFKNTDNYEKIKFTVDNQLREKFFTDEILFQTIIRNILENAIKYSKTREDSFINILIKKEDNWTLIKISDNGIGIPARFQGKIFDIFFRATEKSKGSGLGLYIVKNAIDKLSGKIEVESREGEGSSFSVFFPSPV